MPKTYIRLDNIDGKYPIKFISAFGRYSKTVLYCAYQSHAEIMEERRYVTFTEAESLAFSEN